MNILDKARSVRSNLNRRKSEIRLSPTSKAVRDKHLTYLTPRRLRTLERCVDRIDEEGVEGDVIECGIALGGSAILLGSRMGPGRTLHGYDVFATIPPPTERDPAESHERYATIASGESEGIGGDTYYGYLDDLYERVQSSLREFGVTRYELHRGLFEDTLHPSGAVALAHIDSDWYDPVKLCLERIYPQLSPGGFIILDDYNDYGGAKKATDEFLAANADMSIALSNENVALRRAK
jgi:O-methyltransferase